MHLLVYLYRVNYFLFDKGFRHTLNLFFSTLKKTIKNIYKVFLLHPYINLIILIFIVSLNILLPYNTYCNSLTSIYFVFLVKRKCILMFNYIKNYNNITQNAIINDILYIAIPLFITWYLCFCLIEFLNPIIVGIISTSFLSFSLIHTAYAMSPSDLVDSSNTAGSNTGGSNTGGSNTGGSNTAGSNTAGSTPPFNKFPKYPHTDLFNTRSHFTLTEIMIENLSWCLGSRLYLFSINLDNPTNEYHLYFKWVVEENPTIFPDGICTRITEETLNQLYSVRHKDMSIEWKQKYAHLFTDEARAKSIHPLSKYNFEINNPKYPSIMDYRKSSPIISEIEKRFNK